MAIGLYAGTFDPPTLGHFDIITRAADFCERIYVGVASNPEKHRSLFSSEQRIQLLQAECLGMDNVEVCHIEGATVHAAAELKADVLIRGLRTSLDLDNERAMAEVNRANGFESLFLLTSGHLAHVSSSVVRQAFSAGLPLDGLVSDNIRDQLALIDHIAHTNSQA